MGDVAIGPLDMNHHEYDILRWSPCRVRDAYPLGSEPSRLPACFIISKFEDGGYVSSLPSLIELVMQSDFRFPGCRFLFRCPGHTRDACHRMACDRAVVKAGLRVGVNSMAVNSIPTPPGHVPILQSHRAFCISPSPAIPARCALFRDWRSNAGMPRTCRRSRCLEYIGTSIYGWKSSNVCAGIFGR